MPHSAAVTGQRVLVVGASAGIGQATVAALTERGARVAAASRHGPVEVDVRDESSCRAAVSETIRQLDGLDAVAYCAGVNHLAPLESTNAARWHDLLATNVVGAALVIGAALGELRTARGRVIVCASHAVADPWPLLGAYLTSKAALDELVECFRGEEPEVGWCRLVVGPTLTGMADGWDPTLAGRAFERWATESRLDGVQPVEASTVAARLVSLLEGPELPAVASMVE